jgi:hypothetical protein
MLRSKNSQIAACLFVLCLSVYFLFLSNSVLLVDGYTRFDLTASLVEEGRIIPGCRFPTSQSIFQIPLYLVGRLAAVPFDLEEPVYICKFFVNLINAIVIPGIAVFLFLICHDLGFSRRISIKISLLYAFSTMAFHYARFNAYEPLLSLYLVVSCFSLIRHRVSGKPGYFIGFCVALFWLPLHNNAMFPLVGFVILFLLIQRKYLDLHRRHFVLIGFVLVAAVVASLYYNFARYGSPWLTGYQSGFGNYEDRGLNPRLYIGIYGLLLSPAKSILLYNPVLILSLFSVGGFFREKGDPVIKFYIMGISLYFLLLYSAWWSFLGECAWGPRFLFPIIPFLLLPISSLLRDFRYKTAGRRIVIRVVIIVSIVIQLVSIVVHFKHFYYILSPFPNSRITSIEALRGDYQPFFSQFVILYRAFSHPDYFDLRWFKEFANHPLIYGAIILLTTVSAVISFWFIKKLSSKKNVNVPISGDTVKIKSESIGSGRMVSF